MLQFIDVSSHDQEQYIVLDEDTLYKWIVVHHPAKEWLKDRLNYTFKLEFRGKHTYIVVYDGDTRHYCEEITEVKYL